METKPPCVLVTGASRGLGRSIAECAARAGYSVGIHFASNRDAAEASAAACRAAAPNPLQQFPLIGGDLGSSAARDAVFAQVITAFGHLDALINNAGMAPRVRNDITDATEESYDEVMSVNLKGPYFLSQLAARYWLANPGKCRLSAGYKLIFIGSISANTASVGRGEYCLSKAALTMACQLWATRLAAHGVQVMEIRPGIMETDMTSGVKEKYDKLIADGLVPQKRWGQPEDIGLAVDAVLRGSFPFSTGIVLDVDGGFHLRRL